ncbi:hypothetical protein EON64_19290, partial [archaeon]
MSAFITQELCSISQDHRLTHHEQEERVLQLIRQNYSNVVHFLLSLQPPQFHEALDVLRKYLDVFNEVILHPELPQLLHYLHCHQDTLMQSVKTALDLIKWDMRKNLPKAIVDFQANLDQLFDFCVVYFSGDDLEAAEKAKEVLMLFFQGLPTQYLPRFRQASWTYKTSPSPSNYTVLLRYYALAAELGRDNEVLCQAVQAAGLLEDLVGLLHSSDVLVVINVLDLLVPIATSNAGLEALSDLQVIRWLIDTLCGRGGDVVGGAVRDEVLRTLSALFTRAAKHSMLFIERQHPPSIELFLRTVG